MACLRYIKTLVPLQNLMQRNLLVVAVSKRLQTTVSFLQQPEVPKYTESVEVKDADWKYVERLLAAPTIPEFKRGNEYPSGWRPPAETAPDTPFFVRRTRNHMLPVYLDAEQIRGARKMTVIRHVEGDIWELEKQLRAVLEASTGKKIISQVHEVAMFIKFKGDHVLKVQDWLYEAGF